MRILLCSLSGTLGGVELRMSLEAKLLLKAGYTPAIGINLHPQLRKWAQALRQENIPVCDFDPPPFMEKAWRWRHVNKLRAKYRGARFFRMRKPDLVHVFLPWTNFGGTRLWLAYYCGLPTVISVRNAFARDFKGWSTWHAHHYREAFQVVRGVYAISTTALQEFLSVFGDFLLPGTVIEVIHNGVDTERFRPSAERRILARDALGLSQDALVVGFVGRLDKQKRPWEVVSVFAELKQMFPTLCLVMVGTGPLEQELRHQAKELGVSESIIFTGFQTAVENLFPGFDLFVLLSRNEGFGTVTVEAMASAVPVVATDVPGTQDILGGGKGGFLVPLKDRRAAVDACAELLSDRVLRTQIGKAGREVAVSQYDEQIWAERILAFYTRVFDAIRDGRPH